MCGVLTMHDTETRAETETETGKIGFNDDAWKRFTGKFSIRSTHSLLISVSVSVTGSVNGTNRPN